MALLKVKNLTKRFGGLVAVNRVSLEMEIGRALAMKPRLLLMDEAMAGMHPRDIDEIIVLLEKIAQEDQISIVAMVEHIMRAVVGMTEKIIVLHQGSKIVDTPANEALQDKRAQKIYLGKPKE